MELETQILLENDIQISKINGFILPPKTELLTLDVEQIAGYLSRKSHVFVELLNPTKLKIMNYKDANDMFVSWVKNTIGENSENFKKLEMYRNKIEEPSFQIKKLGENLIEDYNYDYFYTIINPFIYNIKQQFCLLKLEQLFILNKLPTCYLEELTKPNAPLISDRNVFNWIDRITNLNIDKLNRLKEYLDEYFQYLFDRPKSIWKINYLDIPSPFEMRHIEFNSQFVGYLSRKSIAIVTFYNKPRLITNVEANESFMTWYKSIFGKDSEKSLELLRYKSKIENLSESVMKLGSELIPKYNNGEIYTEEQQCLINLEQFLFRYHLPSSYIFNSVNNKNHITNNDAMEWIRKITNNEKKKLSKLKNYLDEYNSHIFSIPKDKRHTV